MRRHPEPGRNCSDVCGKASWQWRYHREQWYKENIACCIRLFLGNPNC